MSSFKHIATFGEVIDFYFRREDSFCYPDIELEGPSGTSANITGQHMSPDEIEELGAALVEYARQLRLEAQKPAVC